MQPSDAVVPRLGTHIDSPRWQHGPQREEWEEMELLRIVG